MSPPKYIYRVAVSHFKNLLNLTNNFYLISGMITYNLYEVCCRRYNCFYNTESPTGYSSFINPPSHKACASAEDSVTRGRRTRRTGLIGFGEITAIPITIGRRFGSSMHAPFLESSACSGGSYHLIIVD